MELIVFKFQEIYEILKQPANSLFGVCLYSLTLSVFITAFFSSLRRVRYRYCSEDDIAVAVLTRVISHYPERNTLLIGALVLVLGVCRMIAHATCVRYF